MNKKVVYGTLIAILLIAIGGYSFPRSVTIVQERAVEALGRIGTQFQHGLSVGTTTPVNASATTPNDGYFSQDGYVTKITTGSCNNATTTLASVQNPFALSAHVSKVMLTPTTANGSILAIYTGTSTGAARYATSSTLAGNAANYGQNMLDGALLPAATTSVTNMASTSAVSQANAVLDMWIASSSEITTTKPNDQASTSFFYTAVAATDYFNIFAMPRWLNAGPDALRCTYKLKWELNY